MALGVHLIYLPQGDHQTFPQSCGVLFDHAVRKVCKHVGCKLYELFLRPDHLHILLLAWDEVQASQVVGQIHSALGESARSFQPTLTLDDSIHITLIPPWHMEVMAAFVRDQNRFHRRFSFQQEVETIFTAGPNAEVPMAPS
jgi:REP element-mobilizing transposase RayT